MDNRHMIIRIIMAVIWLIVGIIGIVRHETMMGIISFAACALFGFSAFSLKKKK